MKLSVDVEVVYASERLLLVTHLDGAPLNIVDVSAIDDTELDQAIGVAFRSLRRQLTERLTTGAYAAMVRANR